MSLILLEGINDVHEPVIAPEGEHDLIILKAETTEKDGKTNILVICGIQGMSDDGHEFANLFHYVSLPGEGDDDTKKATKLLMARRFLAAFEVPMDGESLDIDDLVGCTATLNLKQEEYQGRISNKIGSMPALAEE